VVYLWMPMATWSVVKLVRVLIDWCACIRYEKVRAASVAAILQSVPAGATVQDRRHDGTLLWITIPARRDHEGSGGDTSGMPDRPTC
jgi:hypothetical protein